MANDKLAEFNGIKPNSSLAEGEEKEVKSKVAGTTYKVKRNREHFYCTCPAWRNQTSIPVNARSCKHIISLLGEKYEEARLECMNPGGPPPKGLPVRKPRTRNPQNPQPSLELSSKTQVSSKPVSKPASKTALTSKATSSSSSGSLAKPISKTSSSTAASTPAASTLKGKIPRSGLLKVTEDTARTKKQEKEGQGNNNDDNEDDGNMNVDSDEEDNMIVDMVAAEDEKSKSRKNKPASSASTTVTKRKRADRSPDLEEEDDVQPKKKKAATKPSSSNKGKSSSGKRPAKRQKDVSETEDDDDDEQEEADEDEDKPKKRTHRPSPYKKESLAKKPNKHNEVISEIEDDSDEEEQEKKKSKAKGKGKYKEKPASSKAKTPVKLSANPLTKKRTRDDAQSQTEDDDQANAEKPSSSKKFAPKDRPASKRQKLEEDDDDDGEEEGEEEGLNNDDAADGGDELASIKGIKPNVLMEDGEEKEVQSQTSSSTYKVKRTWDSLLLVTFPIISLCIIDCLSSSSFIFSTCPAWRNQPSAPVNARSCKHLIALLGEKYEAARIKLKNLDSAALQTSKKGKKSGDDDDNGSSDKTDVTLLLANSWDVDKGPDPTGWWISEKLDGVRTFYDGKRMYSRLGNPFTPPQWFLDKLPQDVTLDGELFGGRGEFQNTVSIVKTMNSPHWKGITFNVFDIPSLSTQTFEARMERLKQLFAPGTGSHASSKVILVEQVQAKSRNHVLVKLKEIESLGGEGLMLRKSGSFYEGKRSSTLLKIKSFYDAEAVVTGYKPGKGRNAGVTGAVKCKMASEKTFDVGSGLNDQQRKNPPKVGSIIVYRFQELTKDGIPRFPTFLGEAADKTKPKDAVVTDYRKAGAKKSDA
ncbi:hypothetical protein J3R30DRAFT_3508310 [Lentinula aciculospora]|uniref:SWIM-type domain-containing protein n=1 Tax=Lentinula aciculospora TaxID=153920 RepID=A0A9W9DLC2_9AGAR|nr:hypothetical protein J3R30DRAFT_3508310 [Lentinula aciculospora]